jgi:hypothetical protein
MWQYFIGCKAKDNDGNIGTVTSLDYGTDHIYIDGIMQNDEGWKPILRPLSSMTDEEKREFPDKKRELTGARFDGEYAFLVFTKGARVARVSDILWLMEKGFYVNQCREDECIMEG